MNVNYSLAFYIICCICLIGIVFVQVLENLSPSKLTQPFLRTTNTSALTPSQNCTHYFIVTVAVAGGLGNQLFQYAAAFTLSKVLGLPLHLQSSQEPDRQFTYLTRPYALDQFNIPQINNLVSSSRNDSDCDNGNCYYFNEIDVMSGRMPKLKNLVPSDYFESEIFFAPYKMEIRKMYTQIINTSNITHWLHKIARSESTSVAVHIRRGDFVKEARTIPISYQLRAMKWLNTGGSLISFYIFSDDITYAKKHLENEFSNTMFVSNTNLTSLEEFYLMSKCTHFIIPNSTFSWWAAYLSIARNKIVIAPHPRYPPGWFEKNYKNRIRMEHKRSLYTKFPYPNGWLGLDPYSHEEIPVPFKSGIFIYPQFPQDEFPKCM